MIWTPLRADLVLLFVAALWGFGFPLSKDALAHFPALAFLFWRFLLASLALASACWPRWRETSFAELGAGIAMGLPLGIGYGFQTVGLGLTTSGKAGFITGLNIVFVPLLAWPLLGQRITFRQLLGTTVALVGMGLMCLDKNLALQTGDVYVLGCTFLFAFQLIGVSYFSKRFDTTRVTFYQISTTTLVCLIGSCWLNPRGSLWPIPPATYMPLLYTGLLATAASFWLQLRAQAFTKASHAAVILAQEAVFAVLFGWWWSGEKMSPREIAGAVLMMLAFVVLECRAREQSE